MSELPLEFPPESPSESLASNAYPQLSPEAGAAIAQRIQQLHQTLPPSVRLIAVSKTYSADHIRAAYAAGQRDFGENRVQEASAKQAQLSDLQDITWHLIGQLQSNKARKAIELFDWIHSVDSLKLAERLDRLAGDLHRQPKICFQVKHRPDPSKTGLLPPELTSEVTRICELKHIRVEGLMTIPPLATNDLEKLHIFEENRNLAEAWLPKQNGSDVLICQ